METEAEAAVMWPGAKGARVPQPPEAGARSPGSLGREHGRPGVGPLTPRRVREKRLVFSHQMWGCLAWQPQESVANWLQ